jgi:hypothetical protein
LPFKKTLKARMVGILRAKSRKIDVPRWRSRLARCYTEKFREAALNHSGGSTSEKSC